MNDYESLFFDMFKCEECFSRKEKLLLPGTGNLDSEIVFIGEAPNVHRTFNVTFGMKSKEIVDQFLNLCGLSRENVFITNCVKCIIPHKKVGDPIKCKKFLLRELEIINPKIVVLMGKVASTILLGKKAKFGDVVSSINRKYIVLPHPATVHHGTYTKEQYLKFSDIVKKVLRDEIQR